MYQLGNRFGTLSLLVAAAAAAAMAIPALVAYGHASYDYSMPDDGEVVTASPTELSAFFNDEIRRQEGTYYLRVLDDSGTQVSDGNGVLNDDDRTNIVAPIPELLPDGRYSVHWKTLSDEDGDEAQGVFCFYVNIQPTEQQIAECNAMGNVERDATGTAQAGASDTPHMPATVTTQPPEIQEEGNSNTAVVIVIIVAAAALLGVVAGTVFYLRRR
jgi:methionine-rich copper-binding protein CopC